MSQFGLTTLAEPEASVRIWYEALRAVRPLLVVISGPSGVGKDATIQRMKERGYPCHFVVTATTRARRPNEIDGIDYHFVNEEIFANMIHQGELLEHA
jgi:guanylate kinase